MDHWNEIRTAYEVARRGRISAAAEALGVHHATVIRHIDLLERELGAKLFQRHARGYTPTEAGQELLQVAQTVSGQFGQLANRIRGKGEEVSGDLVVTAVPGFADLAVPAIARFQRLHPGLRVHYLSDLRRFRLEYGEADVALRAGNRPQEPDNIVQPLLSARFGLVATPDYLARHGRPPGPGDLAGHRFVQLGGDFLRAPYNQWLAARIRPEDTVFVSTQRSAVQEAIRAGTGMGFLRLGRYLGKAGLVEVFPGHEEPCWHSETWVVTHADLHRTAKVRQFVAFIRRDARDWDI